MAVSSWHFLGGFLPTKPVQGNPRSLRRIRSIPFLYLSCRLIPVIDVVLNHCKQRQPRRQTPASIRAQRFRALRISMEQCRYSRKPFGTAQGYGGILLGCVGSPWRGASTFSRCFCLRFRPRNATGPNPVSGDRCTFSSPSAQYRHP